MIMARFSNMLCLLLLWLVNIQIVNASPFSFFKPKKQTPIDTAPAQYFRELRRYPHYDRRFVVDILNDTQQQAALKTAAQTYLSFCRDQGIETWLMHGTLLSWWWGKKVMPWDEDLDFQIAESDLHYLAAYHNMTTHYFRYGDMKEGRFFLLDVNPNFVNRDGSDWRNKIDARWVDMHSGLYVDITAARYMPNHVKGQGVMADKDAHEFRDTFLFPLRETTFEGVPAKIPFQYKKMLESEYGRPSLIAKHYGDYAFNEEKMEWVHN